jgi:hypothetical protein
MDRKGYSGYKSSRFEPDELDGFRKALSIIQQYDLVTVGSNSSFRLLREGEYPPLRGTVMETGDNYLLYTTGYIQGRKYPHGHVPTPLRIVDHIGDTAPEQLLDEILVLTKMNFNSANPDAAFPITLDFARAIGDILREIPEDQTPSPRYVFYM